MPESSCLSELSESNRWPGSQVVVGRISSPVVPGVTSSDGPNDILVRIKLVSPICATGPLLRIDVEVRFVCDSPNWMSGPVVRME